MFNYFEMFENTLIICDAACEKQINSEVIPQSCILNYPNCAHVSIAVAACAALTHSRERGSAVASRCPAIDAALPGAGLGWRRQADARDQVITLVVTECMARQRPPAIFHQPKAPASAKHRGEALLAVPEQEQRNRTGFPEQLRESCREAAALPRLLRARQQAARCVPAARDAVSPRAPGWPGPATLASCRATWACSKGVSTSRPVVKGVSDT